MADKPIVHLVFIIAVYIGVYGTLDLTAWAIRRLRRRYKSKVWRVLDYHLNGTAASRHYAISTSLGGFQMAAPFKRP